MSWLNFNDSLNSLKGQISNFANTVLAEDEIESRKEVDSKESGTKCDSEENGNAYRTEDPWSWSAVESKTDQLKTDETITNLKKKIEELQNENRDLIASLDKIDQNHQQNTDELMKMKSKLSEELEIVTEKYEILNMNYNKLALAENGYKKKINELKHKYEERAQQKSPDTSDKCKSLEEENSEMKKRIALLEAEKTRENNLEHEDELTSMTSTIQELQLENKALKIALNTTTELKTANKNENIGVYENEIAYLKNELERFKREIEQKNEIKVQETIVDDKENTDSLNLKEINDKLKGEIEMLKQKYENEKSEFYKEIEILKREKELEISNYVSQLGEKETKLKEALTELNGAVKENADLEKDYCDLQQINRELKRSKIESDIVQQQRYEGEINNLKIEISKLNKNIELKDNVDTDSKKEIAKKLSKLFEIFKDNLDDQESSTADVDSIITQVSTRIKMEFAAFESKLQELNDSIANLQKEKDEEIDRLLDDCEMFKLDLSRKSEELKDAEEECSQLMKNNELLISKLEELKDTGLQTIFESNEENVASMEKQLDSAYKRIQELETSLVQDISGNQQKYVSDIDKNERDIEKLEEEKKVLQVKIEELEHKLHAAESERDNCRILIDKMRLDFETTEFQFSEMNMNLQTLSEEIEKHKMRIDLLVSENENLKSLRQEILKNDEELKLTKNDLSIASGERDTLQEKLEEVKEKYEHESCRLEDENKKLRKQLEELSCEKSVLEERVEQSALSIESLQKDVDISKSDNSILNNAFHSLFDVLCYKKDEYDITEIAELTNIIRGRIDELQQENVKLVSELETYKNKITDVQNETTQEELKSLIASRNELIAIVQTKHQETLTYHAEIQRLSEILKQETEKNILMETEIESLKSNSCSNENLKEKEEHIEKLNDQIEFLRQKCDVLAQSMLEEQQRLETEKTAAVEKEAALTKKLERLQSHLMEVEEHYTQELLQSEQKIALLQARLNEVEKREKDSSNVYTSVSIRANQQNEALTQQLQSMTSQRDEFKKKVLDLEDENNIKSAALMNLQLVLEQFQRDKDADVIRETDRIRRQVKQEQKVQEDLRKEIGNLENQITESKQGLQAALRLTDQLEMSKNQILNLRQEVSVLTEKLHIKEEELKALTSQTDGKVDKSLVKNLIIGFVTSNKNLNKDQKQILKIIATVLDFNEQDHNKVNLNQAQHNSWLESLLSPMAEALPPNESLSRAFVNFLENESKPRVIPSLLPEGTHSETSSVSSSNRTTPTPIVLNEIVLPTFSDFPQHRNSSSILKGVLKDNP